MKKILYSTLLLSLPTTLLSQSIRHKYEPCRNSDAVESSYDTKCKKELSAAKSEVLRLKKINNSLEAENKRQNFKIKELEKEIDRLKKEQISKKS